jgi:hypothetical protein
MKKVCLSVLLILFAFCLFAAVFPDASYAQRQDPGKVYIYTEQGGGSLKEVIIREEIADLMKKVRDKKCALTILGPKSAQQNMRSFIQKDYGNNVKPSDKSVYIISCPPEAQAGEPPGAVCGYIGGVYKCCPPTCR